MSAAQKQAAQRFSTVRITTWIYAAFFLVVIPIYAYDQPPFSHSSRAAMYIGCILCALAALSTLRKSWIGFYFSMILSILMLCGLGIGTIVGWNMIRALQRNWDQFGRTNRSRRQFTPSA